MMGTTTKSRISFFLDSPLDLRLIEGAYCYLIFSILAYERSIYILSLLILDGSTTLSFSISVYILYIKWSKSQILFKNFHNRIKLFFQENWDNKASIFYSGSA